MIHRYWIFILLAVLVSVNTSVFAKNRKVDLIIFMGQSNMAGRGVVNDKHTEDAPDVIRSVSMEYRAFSDTTSLYPITKLFGKTEDNPQGIDDHQKKTGGMVPAFVNACYAQTKTPIIAVSASEGGTRTSQWIPGSHRVTDAMDRFQMAQKWLLENGYDIRRKVMVWTQGESDADNHVTPEEYKKNLRMIVDAMKIAGVEHCYVIQIGEYNGGNRTLTYKPIQQAQKAFCDENEDCTMASTLLSTFKAKGLMKDAFHYYQDAYNLVGEDAGKNVGDCLNKQNKTKTQKQLIPTLTEERCQELVLAIPDHGESYDPENNLSRVYYSTWKKAMEIPGGGLGDIGNDEFLSYFVCGNDPCETHSATIESIKLDGDKAVVQFYINHSYDIGDNPHRTFKLSVENGRWVISDYDDTLKDMMYYIIDQRDYLSSDEYKKAAETILSDTETEDDWKDIVRKELESVKTYFDNNK